MTLTLLVGAGAGTGAAMAGSIIAAARMIARTCMMAVAVVVRTTRLGY
jgi:hypothetical protein